jgi:hypothetical protein
VTGTTWHATVAAPTDADDAVVAAATGWPAGVGPSPLRWAQAVMVGVHAAVGDERWGVDPLSLRLTEAWVATSSAPPPAGEVEVTATLDRLVDLGSLAALRLSVDAGGAEAMVTVAGSGPGLAGGTRPEPAPAPSRPGGAPLAGPVADTADAEPGAVAAFTAWSRDHTPIHTDPEAARAAGLPGPIAPGMFVLALLAAAGARAAGGPVWGVGARFVRPTVVGDHLDLTVAPGAPGRLAVAAEGPRGPVVRRAWVGLG